MRPLIFEHMLRAVELDQFAVTVSRINGAEMGEGRGITILPKPGSIMNWRRVSHPNLDIAALDPIRGRASVRNLRDARPAGHDARNTFGPQMSERPEYLSSLQSGQHRRIFDAKLPALDTLQAIETPWFAMAHCQHRYSPVVSTHENPDLIAKSIASCSGKCPCPCNQARQQFYPGGLGGLILNMSHNSGAADGQQPTQVFGPLAPMCRTSGSPRWWNAAVA